jgi:nucleoside-diphosphate-sugar epimerase
MPVFVTGGTGFLGRRIVTALSRAGEEVIALSRSDASDRMLAGLGARPWRGDLGSMDRPLPAVTAVVHAAAHFRMTGSPQTFARINVDGTRRLLAAARAAGAAAFVQVSAAAVVMDDRGTPAIDADETAATFPDSRFPYIASKARAEAAVLRAAAPGFRTVALRPPGIWGPGDAFATALPPMLRRRQFGFVGGGRFPCVTCHADNVVESVLCTLRGDATGRAYFVNDREPTTFRDFVIGLADALGLDARRAPSLPYPVAATLGRTMEIAWKVGRRRNDPPLSRTMVRLIGRPFTTSDAAARRDLGYVGLTGRAQGLAAYAVGTGDADAGFPSAA